MGQYDVMDLVVENGVEITPSMVETIKGMSSTHSDHEHEVIKEAKENGFVPGVRVKIKWMKGEASTGAVTQFRDRVGGLYCGIKYPVDVKRDDGRTYEYTLDQLELLTEEKE